VQLFPDLLRPAQRGTEVRRQHRGNDSSVDQLGAYTIEIVRAGLEAIPKSQIEAGQSLGLSGLQIFRYVIIFPALRLMFPALASQFILLMLATSVVSQISAQDLFHTASIVQSRTFRDFEVYIVVAAVYLALAWSSACCSPASTSSSSPADDPPR
jgi:ABC-type amino acid transport system permease subunit